MPAKVILDAERAGETILTASSDGLIRRALETAGVIFVEEDGNVPGVRLRTEQ